MKLRTILLGLGAFLLALLVVLPVGWLAPLLPAQVQCAAWRGSIWRGQCTGLTLAVAGPTPLQFDALRWTLHPAALLRLTLHADFQLAYPQGSASGQVEVASGERLLLQNVTLQAPFDRRLVSMLPPQWTGQLDARQVAMRLHGKVLQALSGDVQLRNLNDGRGGALGSYRLVFTPQPVAPFRGTLQDTGGPLAVAASLTIAADRSWVLDGTVAARDGTSAISRNLDLLGPPDASGRRPLSAAGTFN